MTTSTNRIEEIFRDARELQDDALEMLTQGRIRNAAEKSWGATKRATDALILARTGEEPERTLETGVGLRTLSSLDEEVSRACLVRRYHSRQGILHGQCFYHGLCDPLEDTERRIRKTVDYIKDAQQLAGVHRSSAVPVGRQSQAKEPLDLVGDAEKALSEALFHRSEDEQKLLRGCLAVLLGVDIHRVVKDVGGRGPVYCLYTEQGDVTLGTIHLVTSWKRCTDRIAETLGVMASVDSSVDSSRVWRQCVQALLRICEEVTVGDPSNLDEETAAETRSWVDDYLTDRGVPGEEDWQKAAEARLPFVKAGRIHITTLDRLTDWIHDNRGRKLDNHALGQRLRRIGADPGQVHIWVGEARTTRSIWVLPDIFQPPQQDGNAAVPGDSRPDGREDES